MAVNDASQADIWDDNQLTNHWEEVRKEYETYYSIAAAGQDPEEVLKRYEQSGGKDLSLEGVIENGAEHDGPQVDAIPAPTAIDVTTVSANKVPAKDEDEAMPDQKVPEPSAASLAALQNTTSTQDENMKNLMMSWYYAGYYTGYHEGQQSALASTMRSQPG